VPDTRRLLDREAFPAAISEAAEVARENTPEGSFVIYVGQKKSIEWLPYLAWRPTVYTPIPASENRRVVFEKRGIFQGVVDMKAAAGWLEQRDLRGYVIRRGSDGELTVADLVE